jgi:1,4-alpha-glucan branching enzyme
MYAFSERFLLPLSHDEVVHLKRSLLSKMPGDRWQQLANLRVLLSLMWAHPGKKLLFMGGEIGQRAEWSFATELEWFLLDDPGHAGIHRLVRDLNALYAEHAALHELDDSADSFRWIDANDAPHSVFSFIRFAAKRECDHAEGRRHVVCAANLTPIVRGGYRLGVPENRSYSEILNTDAAAYAGSGVGNLGECPIEAVASHGFAQSLLVTLPPLSCLYWVPKSAS